MNYLSPALRVVYYVAIITAYHAFFVLYCMSFVYCQYRRLCEQVVHCGCNSCVVFALMPAQCAVCCVYTTASAICYVCKSCVVFAQCTASTVCHVGATTSPLIIIIFAIFCTTSSAVCYVCKSCVVFALLPVQLLCVVFALLPAKCAMCVSPMLCLHYTVSTVCSVLCLHYCQRSVLCV